MSPHFQTKLFLADPKKIRETIPGIQDSHFISYITLMKTLGLNWINSNYEGKFVNLEDMEEEISSYKIIDAQGVWVR